MTKKKSLCLGYLGETKGTNMQNNKEFARKDIDVLRVCILQFSNKNFQII